MKTGIILAGGESKRIGTDKGLLLLNKRPLISYVIDSLETTVDEIIIVTNTETRSNQYKSILGTSHIITSDIEKTGSPLIGLLTGLLNAKGEYAILAACDTPLIQPSIVKHLFKLSKNTNGTLIIKPNGWIEPIPAVYKVQTAIKQAQKLKKQGDLRLRKVLETQPNVVKVEIENLRSIDPKLISFIDVDTEEHYHQVKEILEKHA